VLLPGDKELAFVKIQMLFRTLEARTLTALHGRQNLGDLKPFHYRFREMPLVSVSSDRQTTAPREFRRDDPSRHSSRLASAVV
jgi:hypothetical protein